MSSPKYRRILLKLSGEALQGDQGFGIDPATVERLADEVKAVHSQGVEVAIVIGGGNIFRGVKASASGMDRANADYMGMLATMMNSIALQDAFEGKGIPTRVQSAIAMAEIAEPYIRRRAIRHFEKGRIVIFGAGTGNPYFTTDTAAALRAMEIGAEILLKGTQVDGIYDKDPQQFDDAKRFDAVSYTEVLQRNLRVMDATAISLCRENKMPIMVFALNERGNIGKAVAGEPVGSLVHPDSE